MQNNKLTQTDAEGRTTHWSYDNLGRVTSRTLPMGQFETFEYDVSGNRIAHTDFKGQRTDTEYDINNRPILQTIAGTITKSWTYDAVGQVLSADQDG
ncbi:RHS repeat domain-containing protein, partial [Leucothrix arctica]